MLINSIRCFLFFINVSALYSQDYKKQNIGRGITSVDDKKKAILEAAVHVYFGFSPIH
jgi:hypothetical protein